MKITSSKTPDGRWMIAAIVSSSAWLFATPEIDPSGPTEVADFLRVNIAADSCMKGTEFSVKIKNGIAVLTGNVKTLDQAERAGERALAAVEVRAVVNEIHLVAVDAADGSLKASIQNALQHNPALDSKRLNVKVSQGKVTLVGEVGTWDEQEIARETVSTIPGVKWIDNKTQVSFESIRTDRQIEAQLKQLIANDPLYDGLSLSVGVKDGLVKLKGKVGSRGEYDRLVRRASVTGVFEVNADRLELDADLKMEGVGDKNFTPEQTLVALGDALKMDKRMDVSLIDYSFEDGVVTLKGEVADAQGKTAAESTARGVPGVIAVNNKLRIQEGNGEVVANAPLVTPGH